MLRFKEFLNERKRMSATTKNWLRFRSSPSLFWLHKSRKYPLPISAPMMRRLKILKTSEKGLHITNIEGMKSLISNQNSARQIAVMTWVSSTRAAEDLFKGGIATDGGVACSVVGDIALKIDWDIYSSPDNQGRRWVDFEKLTGPDDLMKDYAHMIDSVIYDISRVYIPKIGPGLEKAGWPFDWSEAVRNQRYMKDFWLDGKKFIERNIVNTQTNPGQVNLYPITKKSPAVKLFNKGLFQLTKQLFDGAESFLTTHLSYIKKVLGKKSEGSMYNEGLMSDFTIKEIRFDVETATGEYPLHWADELGIPFEFEEGTIAGLDPELQDDSEKLEEIFSKKIKALARGIKIYSTSDKDIDSFFRKFVRKE